MPDNAAGSAKVPDNAEAVIKRWRASWKEGTTPIPGADFTDLVLLCDLAMETIYRRALRKRIDEHMSVVKPTPFGQQPPFLDPDVDRVPDNVGTGDRWEDPTAYLVACRLPRSTVALPYWFHATGAYLHMLALARQLEREIASKDSYEAARLRSLDARVAELPKEPAVLLKLLEQRYLLENLAWDNCPEFVALQSVLRSAVAESARSETVHTLPRAFEEKPVAWLIERPKGTGKQQRTEFEVVLSPLTDDTFMDEGDPPGRCSVRSTRRRGLTLLRQTSR
jgi:hypothetical protein